MPWWLALAWFAGGLAAGAALQPAAEWAISAWRGAQLRALMREHTQRRREAVVRFKSLRSTVGDDHAYAAAVDGQLRALEEALHVAQVAVPPEVPTDPAALHEPLLPAAKAAALRAALKHDPVARQLDQMLAHRCEHVVRLAVAKGRQSSGNAANVAAARAAAADGAIKPSPTPSAGCCNVPLASADSAAATAAAGGARAGGGAGEARCAAAEQELVDSRV